MMLVAFRQGFDPLHIIEAPHSKTVQVNSVSSLEVPAPAERALYNALLVSNHITYNTDRVAVMLFNAMENDPLVGRATLLKVDAWLEANMYRWIALMEE